VSIIYNYQQISTLNDQVVGKKVYELEQLRQKGYPVLPALLIPAPNFSQFLSGINWSDPLLRDLPNSSLYFNTDDWRQLKLIADNLQEYMMGSEIDGQLLEVITHEITNWETENLIAQIELVNPQVTNNIVFDPVICDKNTPAIAEAIKQSWRQLFDSKSLFYWQKVGIPLGNLQPVIYLQAINHTLMSGEIRVQGDWAEINAKLGLDLPITEGQIIPEYYLISRLHPSQNQQLSREQSVIYDLESNYINPANTASVYHLPLPQPYCRFPLQSIACQEIEATEEKEKSEFLLSPTQLEFLQKVMNNCMIELGENFQLKWCFHLPETRLKEQFVITEINIGNVQLSKNWAGVIGADQPTIPVNDNGHIVKGLGVSKGVTRAIAQVISPDHQYHERIPAGSVIILPNVIADYLNLIRKSAGFIMERGSAVCHGAILAREMGIPAIVGAHQATSLIKTGDQILVDGDKGEVFLLDQTQILVENKQTVNPSLAIYGEPHGLISQGDSLINNGHSGIYRDKFNYPPLATKLMITVSQPESLEAASDLPIDGIGLLRAEMMMISLLENKPFAWWLESQKQAELKKRMVQQVSKFAFAMARQPVFYRSLDIFNLSIGKDEQNTIGSSKLLRQHGTYSYLVDPTLFDWEIGILVELYENGYDQIRLVLPFIRSVDEFVFCQQRVQSLWPKRLPPLPLWIMAEVPSVIFLLADYVQAGIEGILIGTNDLTQLLLACDRNDQEMSSHFNSRHPAVLRAIQKLIMTAESLNIPCHLCVDTPLLYPDMINNFVTWGVTAISVHIDAVWDTYRAIAQAEKQLIIKGSRI
jgi:pyruvate,water dikinase